MNPESRGRLHRLFRLVLDSGSALRAVRNDSEERRISGMIEGEECVRHCAAKKLLLSFRDDAERIEPGIQSGIGENVFRLFIDE
ncbi:MAG TPA: hypothetical protein PL193_10310 [Xanthobacteraceae bacterium]|nr:hypothetical protein [Xanthobacteraceae bacterium]